MASNGKWISVCLRAFLSRSTTFQRRLRFLQGTVFKKHFPKIVRTYIFSEVACQLVMKAESRLQNVHLSISLGSVSRRRSRSKLDCPILCPEPGIRDVFREEQAIRGSINYSCQTASCALALFCSGPLILYLEEWKQNRGQLLERLVLDTVKTKCTQTLSKNVISLHAFKIVSSES